MNFLLRRGAAVGPYVCGHNELATGLQQASGRFVVRIKWLDEFIAPTDFSSHDRRTMNQKSHDGRAIII